jgi:hypothetical protein
MENFEKIKELIEKEWAEEKVVIMTVEGAASVPVRQIIKQPAEGLLYDINRDMGTNWALLRDGSDLPSIRIINDIAAAHIIEYLISQQPYDPIACGRRGRLGNIPPDITKRAEKYQLETKPPYDADDIISAYETGANEERNKSR